MAICTVTNVNMAIPLENAKNKKIYAVSLCHICQPLLVWFVRVELPFEQVFRNMLWIGSPFCAAAAGILDVRFDFQALADAPDPLIIDGSIIITCQIISDAAAALVRAFCVNFLHQFRNAPVFCCAGAGFAGTPPIVPCSGYTQDLTGFHHRVPAFFCCPPDCLVLPLLPKLSQSSPLSQSFTFFNRSRSIFNR